MMRDGLYRIERINFCAGFVVKKGMVTKCAPILRKLIKYWIKVADRISD